MTHDADRLEFAVRRELHKGGGRRTWLTPLDTPRWILLSAHIRQRPLAFNEPFHFSLQTESAAILARAAGIDSQLTATYENRPTQFHFFNRGVANVALAHRHTGGFAIACRTGS